MMTHYASEEHAREHARDARLYYGFSVFGPGGWYVGTWDQCQAIGVVAPIAGRPQEMPDEPCPLRAWNDTRVELD